MYTRHQLNFQHKHFQSTYLPFKKQKKREMWGMGGNNEGKKKEILTNPLAALNGLGCTLCNTQCRCRSTFFNLFPAGVPQARNTTPRVRSLATVSMTFWVNFSHPWFA
jgi:hypothetical protein